MNKNDYYSYVVLENQKINSIFLTSRAEPVATWYFSPTSVGPKVTMQRGVVWPKDSLLLGGRGRESQEREREGQVLKYPSVRLGMI
jgi:hypothetical protein